MTASLLVVNWHSSAIWLIALCSIALVLIRPRGLSEAWWAALGAVLLVALQLISMADALAAVRKGHDVYFFLTGMMIMSELARHAGVFDWVAQVAVRASGGSRSRLFLLIYAVGIVVTVFLSNDATAVVLTPAVLAAVRTGEAEPLPYLMICAAIANAASFVLPISNPANLVVYSSGMPPLAQWVRTFGLPSLASILITYVLLRWLSRSHLRGAVKIPERTSPPTPEGKLAIYGIGLLTVTLTAASALSIDLGAPALLVGIAVAAMVSLCNRAIPGVIVKHVAWSVLPLVAGLFVIVEAINQAGALPSAISALHTLEAWPHASAALTSGFGIALLSNLMNNLPSGLISGAAVQAAHATGPLRDAVLIGVDLGPNLSVTGSLATILWLIAIRREGQTIGFWKFLRWGVVIMPPALAAAILCLLLSPYRA